ncbi:speckle-type POZ protein B-like [Argiope bruennichi]|uniref:speckle-type POZ protein B-like n=1 Tax=Argiope bruennichi TaxID=94029 RepID=UPI00249499F1|nr:speckle-type POZ protein B-like [Argiope bruennichi]
MERRNQYLPNDVFSLSCECVYSSGKVLFEYCGCGMIFPEFENEVVAIRKEQTILKDKSQNTSHLMKDLKSMYEDAICSNAVLRTSTSTFPVHKGILSARSPVFRSMFSSDMKENNSGYVDIDDFEDDIVHRMLLYMYTDSLEDLRFENAPNLYRIADKYQIFSLRNECSSFLKDGLCRSNACNFLVFADLHNDDDLKTAAQGYIMVQRKEFFGSEEWRQFMRTHTDIAADIMCRKICEQ